LLLTDPIAVPEWKDRRHEVFYYLNLVSEIEKRMLERDTVSAAFPDTSLTISDERKARARELLASHGVDPDATLVTMGAGSTNSMAKRWPAERFVEVARHLVAEHGANVVLLGSPDEAAVAAQIASAAGEGVVNLAGKTKLADAVALLSIADLMISNDMGLAHIAPAVGAPTVVLFGPTNPTTTRPWGDNVKVLQRDVSCGACDRGDRTERHNCTRWPSVEVVKDALEAGLEEGRTPITVLTEVM
jgi:heptosyltransferase-2